MSAGLRWGIIGGVLVILIAVGALAAVGTAAVVAAKRREARPDPPGVASVALFRGGDAYLHEGELDAKDFDVQPPGHGLIEAIVGALARHGFTAVGEPERIVGGWEAAVGSQEQLVELRLGAYDDAWSLIVSDNGGGPPAPSILPRVAAALAALDRLRDITWISRQQWRSGS